MCVREKEKEEGNMVSQNHFPPPTPLHSPPQPTGPLPPPPSWAESPTSSGPKAAFFGWNPGMYSSICLMQIYFFGWVGGAKFGPWCPPFLVPNSPTYVFFHISFLSPPLSGAGCDAKEEELLSFLSLEAAGKMTEKRCF